MIRSRLACQLFNTFWERHSRPAYLRFLRAAGSVRESQEDYLLNNLRKNERSVYGRRYGFNNISSVSDYRDTVPVTAYEDYAPYIERISEGEEGVLTSEKVKLFEPTSGTVSARKLIPYTESLRAEFQRGIAPWIYTLFRKYPEAKKGKTYWSISPASFTPTQSGCIPVGFDKDASYLGFWGRWIFSMVAVQLPVFTDVRNSNSIKKDILISLLANRNLGLISVWSPSFLTILCEFFLENHAEILDSLATGELPGSAKRAEEINSFGRSLLSFRKIWPALVLISCWSEGPSEIHAKKLQSYFPGVEIQGKGLLATEAFVSFPVSAGRDPVLAVNSHFFEFLDADGISWLADEVKRDQTYSVVVTTGGGLYRYELGDYVKVTGFEGDLPAIRFVGKSDDVSDLFGEKLHVGHVSRSIDSVLPDYSFAMLAPESRNDSWWYTLFVQDSQIPPGGRALLDGYLGDNPNYRQCLNNGQLQPARIFLISEKAAETYSERMMDKGMRFGEIKLTQLSRMSNWSSYFVGRYLDN